MWLHGSCFYHTSNYLGFKEKGLYVSAFGGLPLFSSGNRIGPYLDRDSQKRYISFSEPCDPSHVQIVREENSSHGHRLRCARSQEFIGWIKTVSTAENGSERQLQYFVDEDCLCFLPLQIAWPLQSQPENFWGSEGQYRSWGTESNHELSARPLSY